MRRREFMAFLGSAAAVLPLTASAQQPAPPNPVRQDWLDRRKESALEPELPIVDPHHHLWVRPGWRYMLDDFLADTNSGHNIVATVFVQAISMYRDSGPIEMRPVGETEFVNGMAAICASGYCGKTRVAAGIVGHADVTLGSRVEPVLAALQRAGRDRFRGIRYITAWDADTSLINPSYPVPPRLLAEKTFREGFAVLGRLGLSFDGLVFHPQLDDVANLAGAFPDTKIVLNHVGRLVGTGVYAGKLKEEFPRWAASMKALAAHENVYVKVGRDAGTVDQHIADRQIPDTLVEACHVAALDHDLAMRGCFRRRSSRGFDTRRNGCGGCQPLQHGTSSNSHGFLPYLTGSVAQVCWQNEWGKY